MSEQHRLSILPSYQPSYNSHTASIKHKNNIHTTSIQHPYNIQHPFNSIQHPSGVSKGELRVFEHFLNICDGENWEKIG